MPINSRARRKWHMTRIMFHAIFFEPIYHQTTDFAKSVKRVDQDTSTVEKSEKIEKEGLLKWSSLICIFWGSQEDRLKKLHTVHGGRCFVPYSPLSR
jgi:hypothetical protein